MSILGAVQVVAVLSTGLKAGGLFGDQMSVRFARRALSPPNFVKFQQTHLRRWEKFMPSFSVAAMLSCIAWLALIRFQAGSLAFALLTLAALAHVASMVLAVTGCMPVNSQLMTWTADVPPSDVMVIWSRWERVNAMRAALGVIAFLALAIVLAT